MTTMLRHRRYVLLLAALGAAAAQICAAQASGPANAPARYPSRPVVVVTPTPGGASDAIARVITAEMGKALNASFVVDARPGAGGNIAAGAVAKSPPDGHTLLLAVSTMLTVNPSLYSQAGFDPIEDFSPVALLASAPYMLAVNPSLGVNSVAELVDHVKRSRVPVYYSSPGNGTPNHLLAVLFNKTAHIDMQHVPYRNTTGATTDLVSGQVQVTFGSLSGLLPFVRSGRLKALAVTSAERSRLMPELPTVAETFPSFHYDVWYALAAPKGTAASSIATLTDAAKAALAKPAVQAGLEAQGAIATPSTPAELSSRIGTELESWRTLIKADGIRLD